MWAQYTPHCQCIDHVEVEVLGSIPDSSVANLPSEAYSVHQPIVDLHGIRIFRVEGETAAHSHLRKRPVQHGTQLPSNQYVRQLSGYRNKILMNNRGWKKGLCCAILLSIFNIITKKTTFAVIECALPINGAN